MQVKTLTCLGFVLAVICMLQVASGKPDCKLSQLEELSNEFCDNVFLTGLCKNLLTGIRLTCSYCNNADNSNISTTTTAAA